MGISQLCMGFDTARIRARGAQLVAKLNCAQYKICSIFSGPQAVLQWLAALCLLQRSAFVFLRADK